MLGYVLHQKIWCQFRIKDISTVSHDNHSRLFEEQLELDEKYKDLLKVCRFTLHCTLDGVPIAEAIQAFINNHQSAHTRKSAKPGSGQLTDFIENKGNGLVILLHGMLCPLGNQERILERY